MNLQELKKEMPVIFDQVKKNVRKVYGRHRAGLNLGLIEMGMYRGGFIGGMHVHPGTDIVMNKTPLIIILREQPDEIVWAYTYHITLRISEKIFKDVDHPTIILAKNGIGTYFPNLPLIYAPQDLRPDGKSIEYVYNFDHESYDYYS